MCVCVSHIFVLPLHVFTHQKHDVNDECDEVQGWEGDFGNAIGYKLLVTVFKM